METSESINEIATALAKAQGVDDRTLEASILKSMLNKNFAANQYIAKSELSRFVEKIAFGASDCWYWIGAKSSSGYGLTSISNENKAHRLAWKLFRGYITSGMNVLHKCDIRCCVNPDHLFIGTQDDNMKDCARKGRIKSPSLNGERNPMSKLNDEQVLTIRGMAKKIPQSHIAKFFDVSKMTISRIVRMKSWKTI